MTKYVLDANIFIDAKNHYYGMDFCPAFWDWLIAANKKGIVISIEAVFDELKQQPDEDEDELSQWVKGVGACLFLEHDQAMVNKLETVATWAQGQNYTIGAVNTFLDCADMYLVAYAIAHEYTVVTLEKPSLSINKLKIPDACRGLGVPWLRPFEMLRIESAKFCFQPFNSDAIDAIRH